LAFQNKLLCIGKLSLLLQRNNPHLKLQTLLLHCIYLFLLELYQNAHWQSFKARGKMKIEKEVGKMNQTERDTLGTLQIGEKDTRIIWLVPRDHGHEEGKAKKTTNYNLVMEKWKSASLPQPACANELIQFSSPPLLLFSSAFPALASANLPTASSPDLVPSPPLPAPSTPPQLTPPAEQVALLLPPPLLALPRLEVHPSLLLPPPLLKVYPSLLLALPALEVHSPLEKLQLLLLHLPKHIFFAGITLR
jgi:hypothetical protein